MHLSCNIASVPSFNKFKIHCWLISIYFIESTAEEMSWTIRLNRFVYIFFYCLMEWILSALQKRRRIYFQSTRIAFWLQWSDWFSQTFHDLIRTIWVEPNRRQMYANIRLSTEKMSRTECESNRFQAVRLRSVKSTDLYMENWSIDSTQLIDLNPTLWNVSIALFLKLNNAPIEEWSIYDCKSAINQKSSSYIKRLFI